MSTGTTMAEPGPLGDLPRIRRRQARLSMLLGRAVGPISQALGDLADLLGPLDGVEVVARGSGLRRPGVVAQLSWPRLGTRVGLSIDNVLAHEIVDRLLGHERTESERRLQVTPVEWGVLSYLLARCLRGLHDAGPGPLGPWDLVIDRVGPEPFQADSLGEIATVVWYAGAGPSRGAVRLWLPELVVALLQVDGGPSAAVGPGDLAGRFAGLSTTWRALAGTTTLARGLASLRPRSVLPLDPTADGHLPTLDGPVELVLSGAGSIYSMSAEPLPGGQGDRLRLLRPPRRQAYPMEARPMPPAPSSDPTEPAPTLSPTEVPVTLVVELGRLNLPISRLADLRPGDVLDLSHHAREPVELTSGGKLVARAELIQIDTELGVRILSVYL
jgi:flagellar motor switch/type III secretory pathway protein FliN